MKLKFIGLITVVVLFSGASQAQKVELISKQSGKQIEVRIDGRLFTSYCVFENVYKPILYPVYTINGTEITRGFPLNPKEGERDDHIHQVGIWLNYGNVNGVDFWGTGHTGSKEPGNGVIRHISVTKTTDGVGEAVLGTTAGWIMPSGKEILSEQTEYHFIARGALRIIDRITTLTATDTTVLFKDTKEGMFGIRVARQLELPANEMVALLDATGKPSKEKVSAMKGATGNYLSSEGLTGDAVWGTRAKWMDLFGSVGDEKISIVICDHPKNQGYPTYWHARGYGLFAANPLGWSDFTKGKDVLGFKLNPKQSVTFRYRVIISSGNHLTASEIENLYSEFSKKY